MGFWYTEDPKSIWSEVKYALEIIKIKYPTQYEKELYRWVDEVSGAKPSEIMWDLMHNMEGKNFWTSSFENWFIENHPKGKDFQIGEITFKWYNSEAEMNKSLKKETNTKRKPAQVKPAKKPTVKKSTKSAAKRK